MSAAYDRLIPMKPIKNVFGYIGEVSCSRRVAAISSRSPITTSVRVCSIHIPGYTAPVNERVPAIRADRGGYMSLYPVVVVMAG